MPAIAQVQSIDHVVLTCRDIKATIDFYTSVCGMSHESFESGGATRESLKFGKQKLNLHQAGKEFEPKATLAKPGTADLCFVVATPVDKVMEGLKEKGIEVLESGEVVARTGAVGKLRSVYIRDPDGNLIELSNYQE
ncbi:glyoxalase domain-containing protein [Elsinoe australis]|uniref:Glyoxalase domain-containing protein n=1 Tax=Elsinoe australis TaxID=40998 RepID=A0A4U7B494_9PEZI|nr:glyoxalase domain-containing protein [Elsinoe australis]